MDDPAEQLIRRALGRRPPPTLGPTLVDDVLQRVAGAEPTAESGVKAGARKWIAAAVWLPTVAACVAVLAPLEWSGSSRAVAWGLALALVPLSYSAALWPGGFVALLALCGGPLPGERHEGSRARVPHRSGSV